jgi:hypothetical protein
MRVRTVLTSVSAAGMLATLAACGSGPVDAAVSMNPANTGSNHQPGVANTGPATTTPATTTPATAAAHPVAATETAADPASFSAQLVVQRQGVAMIMLTNTGRRPVTVRGWSSLSFTNAAGEALDVPERPVNVPGPSQSISVVPGGSVFAPVEWTEGDKADASTYVADGVRVVPPGATKPVDTKFVGIDGSTPGYYEFDMKSVEIGTFQPSTHNLLEF